jgi:hypothetical protein
MNFRDNDANRSNYVFSMFSNAFIMPKKPYIDVYCFCVVQMEDLYPIVEEGPKYRGKQSIKLRIRFEPQGYSLNPQFKANF